MASHLVSRLVLCLSSAACFSLPLASLAHESDYETASSTYGGPITVRCQKVEKQIEQRAAKLEVKDNQKVWANIGVDETGKIVEVVGENNQTFKDFLFNLEPIEAPPITNGKHLWLMAYYDKAKGRAQVQLKDVDFGIYMRNLQRKIARHWYAPKETAELDPITVEFKVGALGVISDLKLGKSSGSDLCDQAALEAVRASSPFAPLPDGAPLSVDVNYAFKLRDKGATPGMK